MLLGLGVAVLLSVPSGESSAWRLEAGPRDEAERALRAAVEQSDETRRLEELGAVAARHPGTVTGGLAHLAAGLLLLEEDRAEEALVHLAHADVLRSRLRDHALLATGRAQHALNRPEAAAQSLRGAARVPDGTVLCSALPEAATILRETRKLDEAATVLEEIVSECERLRAEALADLGQVQIDLDRLEAAAATLDRLDREYPASAAARKSLPRLRSLSRHLPPASPAERARRTLKKGEALLAARLSRDALDTLRQLRLQDLPPGDLDRARLALGRALLARRRRTEGYRILGAIPSTSPLAPEAAWHAARDRARRAGTVAPYVGVADTFPRTEWAQRALRAAANHYQSDARDEKAVPFWQRLLDEYPDGLYVETASWRVGWSEFRAHRYRRSAYVWELAARLRPPTSATPGLLYWAARSHLALGHRDRAHWLLDETVQRFKHSYHGMRAQEQMARLGYAPTLAPPVPPSTAAPAPSGPRAGRLRELLLIDRFGEAAAELRRMGNERRVRATLAWAERRRGQLRPAINIMKKAYPHWVSAAGDHLPDGVWRILVPLEHEEELVRQAKEEGLDPALVAGLIMQESTFDPRARSRAGARGLMQILPGTGRDIARRKGVRFRTASLYDPKTNLDFGTTYLRQVTERFGGEVERTLAGYNAGPRRASEWDKRRPGMTEEEFIETIPFTETRFYVRLVLANRAQYRRIYGLGLDPGPAMGGTRQ